MQQQLEAQRGVTDSKRHLGDTNLCIEEGNTETHSQQQNLLAAVPRLVATGAKAGWLPTALHGTQGLVPTSHWYLAVLWEEGSCLGWLPASSPHHCSVSATHGAARGGTQKPRLPVPMPRCSSLPAGGNLLSVSKPTRGLRPKKHHQTLALSPIPLPPGDFQDQQPGPYLAAEAEQQGMIRADELEGHSPFCPFTIPAALPRPLPLP